MTTTANKRMHVANEVFAIQTADAPIVHVGGAQVQFLSTEAEFIAKTLDVLIGILQPGVSFLCTVMSVLSGSSFWREKWRPTRAMSNAETVALLVPES